MSKKKNDIHITENHINIDIEKIEHLTLSIESLLGGIDMSKKKNDIHITENHINIDIEKIEQENHINIDIEKIEHLTLSLDSDTSKRLLAVCSKPEHFIPQQCCRIVNKRTTERIVSIEFTGTEDLSRRLLLLEKEVRQRVAVDAIEKVNRQLIERVKSAAPSYTGTLRRSIAAKAAVYKSGKIAVGIVGPESSYSEYDIFKRGKTRKIKPSKYAHLPDLGTKQRVTKSGANRGRVAPQQFMERVRLNYLNEAIDIFRNAVNDAVNAAGGTE